VIQLPVIAVAEGSATKSMRSFVTSRQGTTCGDSPEALGDIVPVPGDLRHENHFIMSIRYLHVGSVPAGWIYQLDDGREVFQPASSISAKDAHVFGVRTPPAGNGGISNVHGRPDLSPFDVDRCILRLKD